MFSTPVVLIIAMIAAFMFGWVTQTVGLCLVYAIRRFIANKQMLFFTLLSCGSIAMVASLFYSFIGIEYPFFSPNRWTFYLFAGGIIFGVGAVLNDGCNIGSIMHLTRGDSSMIITILGWIIGEYMWRIYGYLPGLEIAVPITAQLVSLGERTFYFSLLIIAVPAWLLIRYRREKRIWAYTTALGVIASVLYVVSPEWTPTRFIFDLQEWFVGEKEIEVGRMLTVFSALAGMLSYTVYKKIFKFSGFNFKKAVHRFFAGILMGVGAAMALGGNDSHLFIVFPNLTLSSFTPLASMCLGVWLSLLVEKKWFKESTAVIS